MKIAETLDRANAVQYLRQAVEAYREALRLKPDYVKAMNNLGAAYNKLGQYQEAVALLLNATRAKPDFPEAHYNLGTALYNTWRLQRRGE